MVDFRKENSFSHGLQATFGILGWYLVIGLIGGLLATVGFELSVAWFILATPLVLARIFQQVDKMVGERLESYHLEVHADNSWGDISSFDHEVIKEREGSQLVRVTDGEDSIKYTIRDGEKEPQLGFPKWEHDTEWLRRVERYLESETQAGNQNPESEPDTSTVEEETDPWFQGDNGFKHKVVGDRSRGKLVEVSDGDESAKFFVRDGDVTSESKRVESAHDDEWLNRAENHIRRYVESGE